MQPAHQTYYCTLAKKSSPRSQRDTHIAPTCIQNSSCQCCTKFGYHTLVLVSDNGVNLLTKSLYNRATRLVLLHEHHSHRYEGTLSNERHFILQHWLDNIHRVRVVSPCTCTSNTDSNACTIAYMWVIRLC